MATSNSQRFLQGQHATDDRNLALKLFWGVVLEAFRAKTVFWDNTGNVIAFKNISEGKSWSFPIIGDDPTPTYHTPGVELLGQDVSMDEGTITIDDILVSHYDVPLDQIVMSHFDVIQPFARKLGRSLAIDLDKKLASIGISAARTAAVSGIHSGGQVVERVNGTSVETAYAVSSTGAANFRADLSEMAQLFDEDNVPEDGRFAFITPYIRRVLQFDTNFFDKDLTAVPVDLHRRILGILEGFLLIPTNHLPITTITGTGFSKYNVDGAHAGAEGEPVCLCLCGAQEGSAGIGFVQASGIVPHMEQDERRNTTFMKAQMYGGAGVLAPWCAGEIRVDNS